MTLQMDDSEQTRRLFFALWPDDDTREQLAERQAQLAPAGRPVKQENLHMTLAFVGDVNQADAQWLGEAASLVQTPSFNMTLNRAGFFQKPRIAWAGPEHEPPALDELHRDLMQSLVAGGFVSGARQFHPHVTLARKSEPPSEQALDPLNWPVHDFVLVESRLNGAGANYHVLARFPLASMGHG